MSEQLVKKTTSGKVNIVIKSSLKLFFKNLLELFMNDVSVQSLDADNVNWFIYIGLINEVYLKYNTPLSMAIGDQKITITKSQALAIWALCNHYNDYAYANPSMGGLLLQLHQKLS